MPSSPPQSLTTDQWLKALEENMQDLETASPDKTFKGVIYGGSGAGKTVLSVMLAQHVTPKNKTILYIDYAEGWTSLENHPAYKARVKRQKINGLSNLEGIALLIQNAKGSFADVGCIIIDEYSSFVDRDLDQIVKKRSAEDARLDPDTPDRPAYNISKTRALRYLSPLIHLSNVHLIVVAHEKEDKDANQVVRFAPSFNPSAARSIKEPMHVICRLENETKNVGGALVDSRTVQVHPSYKAVAKCRIAGLDRVVTTNKFISVVKEWVAGKVKTQEEAQPVNDAENTVDLENYEGLTPVQGE